MEEVIKNSTNSNWYEAKEEWFCCNVIENSNGYCTCGHHLHNLYIIRNKKNGSELTVGSSCVKKFENETMLNYVKLVEDNIKLKEDKEKAKKDKRIVAKDNKYQLLVLKQSKNDIAISIKIDYVEEFYNNKLINNIEYDFYKQIYNKIILTEKQNNWKRKLNDKFTDLIQKVKL